MFNKNRSCIEIIARIYLCYLLCKFNKNRSCIEIRKKNGNGDSMPWFNKNRSCIEIGFNKKKKTEGRRLIKTEVVLK